MKLILLLLAIYTLIFYQRYKIGKLKEPFSGTEIVAEGRANKGSGLEVRGTTSSEKLLSEKRNRFTSTKAPESWEYRPLVFYK